MRRGAVEKGPSIYRDCAQVVGFWNVVKADNEQQHQGCLDYFILRNLCNRYILCSQSTKMTRIMWKEVTRHI